MIVQKIVCNKIAHRNCIVIIIGIFYNNYVSLSHGLNKCIKYGFCLVLYIYISKLYTLLFYVCLYFIHKQIS